MIKRPYIGQQVRLNDESIKQIDGLKSQKEIEAACNMIILGMTPIPVTDKPIWELEVSGPLSCYLITNYDVDTLKQRRESES
jgi:hypothetical protein